MEYLTFTSELELVAVLPVTSLIARRQSGLHLSEQMCTDAFAITTDEAWHAQFTEQLMQQIEQECGLGRDPAPISLHARLAEVAESIPPEIAGLEQLIFAAVSETLISGLLTKLPSDPRLALNVRECVSDHALDEGRHHAYFKQFIPVLWARLTRRERSLLGPVIPRLIHAFLLPDRSATVRALEAEGLSPEIARGVVGESMPAASGHEGAAMEAAQTIEYFANLDVLDDPATREAFESAGLIPN